MPAANTPIPRRSLLQKMAAVGLAVPAAGALGVACASNDSQAARDSALQAMYDRSQPATPVPTAAAAQTVANQAVDLQYLPNPTVPAPITRKTSETVKVNLEVKEVEAKLADGAGYRFWTFGGTIPGPMIRCREGDDVELTLSNPTGSQMSHNIDLHAVTGPGGGAVLTSVAPGETKAFRFKALHPGVFLYHCATAPIDLHISNGMYGAILVEPAEGLPPVDREYYIGQNELYTTAKAGTPGMADFDLDRMADERPTYVVFNGAMGALLGDRALTSNVGETVRIFFTVGGPNLTSHFHIIGEHFDRALNWGSFGSVATDVQTIGVPSGDATMVELKTEVPGTFLLVDHAISRVYKGAIGHLTVTGPDQPDIYRQL